MGVQENMWKGALSGGGLLTQVKALLCVLTPSKAGDLVKCMRALEEGRTKRNVAWASSDPLDSLLEDALLKGDTADEEEKAPARTPGAGDDYSHLLEEIRILKGRARGQAVILGRFVFESAGDWNEWKQARVSDFDFGNLVDIKSVLEFFPFCAGDSLTKLLKQLRGATTINMYGMPKACVVLSFQDILPIGFGASQGTVIGALPKAESWEGKDGTEGLQKFLTDHTPSVDSQITSAILRMDHADAHELALLCLQLSLAFLVGLMAFITRWYRQLEGAGVYARCDCWQLVCDCVMQIFDELHLARSTARNAYITSESGRTCNMYTWATLRAHMVMADFLRYKFDNHLSMSSVITKFTVKTSPITPMSMLKADVAKVKKDMVDVALCPGLLKTTRDELAKVKNQLHSAQEEIRRIKEKIK